MCICWFRYQIDLYNFFLFVYYAMLMNVVILRQMVFKHGVLLDAGLQNKYFKTLAPLLRTDFVKQIHVCAIYFGRSSVSHFKIICSLPY
jgi:hypothetical protein